MILNLVERYKANLKLHVRSQNLYNQLQDERNQLKEVNEALKQAQKTIVHQEKKAMLGQLIAGFAHEINNPATALLRSAETLEEETNSSEGIPAALKKVFEESLKQLPASTEEMRQKMELLEAPSRRELPRSLKRKIAGTPEPLFSALSQIRETEKLSDIVQRFYNARNLQNIRSAAKRIADFAGSLKNYSRQDNNRIEKLDVTLGIKDSLQILSHRLKFITLQTMLQPLPATCADHGELNQVWTNIIIKRLRCIARKRHSSCFFGMEQRIHYRSIRRQRFGSTRK